MPTALIRSHDDAILVFGALAPSRAKIIASTAVSAMFCGFISYVSICSSYDHQRTDALAVLVARCKLLVSQACLSRLIPTIITQSVVFPF